MAKDCGLRGDVHVHLDTLQGWVAYCRRYSSHIDIVRKRAHSRRMPGLVQLTRLFDAMILSL